VADERLTLVRRLQEAWAAGEPVVWPEMFHPDVEFLPHRAEMQGAYRGIAGIEAFVADTSETFERFEPALEYEALGDVVLAWGPIHVRARGSGIEMDVECGGIFEFRDGRIIRWEDFGSKEKAIEAAGVEGS
jgi:ketosteroid isomerase-like protein